VDQKPRLIEAGGGKRLVEAGGTKTEGGRRLIEAGGGRRPTAAEAELEYESAREDISVESRETVPGTEDVKAEAAPDETTPVAAATEEITQVPVEETAADAVESETKAETEEE
jgi:hypothetical protein